MGEGRRGEAPEGKGRDRGVRGKESEEKGFS
jgi:hypothetical protein